MAGVKETIFQVYTLDLYCGLQVSSETETVCWYQIMRLRLKYVGEGHHISHFET